MTMPGGVANSVEYPFVDAHVHVWGQDVTRFPFMPLDGLPSPPATSASVEEFFAPTAPGGLRPANALLIQPRVYGFDHAYLFDSARRVPGRVRVMPLLNPTRQTSVAELRRLASEQLTAGIRISALGAEPAKWLSWPESNAVWDAATELELPVGLLIDPPQLPLVATIATSYPDLTIVIDHLARCTPALYADWAGPLLELAGHDRVHVKLSAIDALSGKPFPFSDMWPLMKQLHSEYGADRLLWGSDWPHCEESGRYGTPMLAIKMALEAASDGEVDAIMALTATRLFGLDVWSTET